MSYVDEVLEVVKKKNADQPEFLQAVTEVLESLRPCIDANEEVYRKNAILERITDAAASLKDHKDNAQAADLTEQEQALLAEASGFVKKFEEAMDDDFNTADALAAVFELVKFANTNVTEESSKAFAAGLLELLVKLCDVLGIIAVKKEEILDKEIEDLIQERQEARKAKNFARADEIRDELLAKGIILKDTREGVKWKRA